MTMSRAGLQLGGGMALAMALACTVSAATPRHRHAARSASPPITLGSLGSFTPAAADPRVASSFGRGGLGNASGFRFTPSGGTRQVTVAVRARASTAEQAQRSALATGAGTTINPYAYNLGVSVGWKRFAITSDYARVDLGGLPGSRESADVAFSFAGRRWSTRLALAADRALGDVPRLLGNDRNVSVDLGGSYSINNRLDVTGGVRYRMEDDRLRLLTDDRRDGQAVYVGTAFRF